jgi:hypothetical protein
MAKHRVIMRIEVSPRVPGALTGIVKRFGSTHASVQSRVLEWLAFQDDVTVASILGLYPKDLRAELPERIVRAIGKAAGDFDGSRT